MRGARFMLLAVVLLLVILALCGQLLCLVPNAWYWHPATCLFAT